MAEILKNLLGGIRKIAFCVVVVFILERIINCLYRKKNGMNETETDKIMQRLLSWSMLVYVLFEILLQVILFLIK